MKVLEKLSPEWFQAAWKNLELIENNADAYEDPEEGDKAPSKEVFEAVKGFLNTLKDVGDTKLEEPRFFVSPNGQIVVAFGSKKRSLDIRFTPNVYFYFKDSQLAPATGDNMNDAVQLTSKYFRI